MSKHKLKVATCSLAGCFGCHMSFLDMDEAFIELQKQISFDRSPFTDLKELGECDLGLIEGGLCNKENREILQLFRQKCRILVSVGACAINGGLPALRNNFSVQDCLEEVYEQGVGQTNHVIPDDPELPPLLEKVIPIHEVVTIDYFLPGCPPPAEAFLELITALLENRQPQIAYQQRKFD